MLLSFNKPYSVLSQFTPEPGSTHRTLSEFGFPPDVYPIGRLDADSEGLLLLTDEAPITTQLLDVENKHERTYAVQVEGIPNSLALHQLEAGVVIKGYTTRRCKARLITTPAFDERDPPIRVRKSIPTTWIEMKLIEGKNRQVRRMTAAIGFPALRLVRIAVGGFQLNELPVGRWRMLDDSDRRLLFSKL